MSATVINAIERHNSRMAKIIAHKAKEETARLRQENAAAVAMGSQMTIHPGMSAVELAFAKAQAKATADC